MPFDPVNNSSQGMTVSMGLLRPNCLLVQHRPHQSIQLKAGHIKFFETLIVNRTDEQPSAHTCIFTYILLEQRRVHPVAERFQPLEPMTKQSYPQLSKSRFMAGLQCLKRLYLECHHRDLADPVEPAQQAIFDSGTAVGDLARQRFPGGRLVEERYFEQRNAERTTRRLLSDSSVTALYEAAFTYRGIHSRVDILRRTECGEFDLIEVKSTTGVKDVHIPDVAIQMHVVEGYGIPVRRAYLMHIDRTYICPGGDHDLEGLFALEDVTEEARSYLDASVPSSLKTMWRSLESAETLAIETGRHCNSPYRCPFFGHCHTDDPEHPVRSLPNLRQALEERLSRDGIYNLRDIPPDYRGLSILQRRVLDSVATERPYIGPELESSLSEIEYPASFIDFETFSPAVPMYSGTSPYQTIPFQWSLHVRNNDGRLRHNSFLDEGPDDPRERFITSLLTAVSPNGSVVTYSGYEAYVLSSLARAFPTYERDLLELRSRIVDLLQLIRGSYYHPGFHGSFSIKSVVSALRPGPCLRGLGDQGGGLCGSGLWEADWRRL